MTVSAEGRTARDLGEGKIVIEPSSNFPPQEDGYERLWTPQRMVYILHNEREKENDKQKKDSSEESCPFCVVQKKNNADGLIVGRGKSTFILMNLYPYNCGHVMVLPFRHVSSLLDLTMEELVEFEAMTQKAIRIINKVSHPDGFNIGINQGEVAGAGIATHLHQHVVPRWKGDSNFLPIVAQTRTMPILLEDLRRQYADEFDRSDEGSSI